MKAALARCRADITRSGWVKLFTFSFQKQDALVSLLSLHLSLSHTENCSGIASKFTNKSHITHSIQCKILKQKKYIVFCLIYNFEMFFFFFLSACQDFVAILSIQLFNISTIYCMQWIIPAFRL